MKTFHGSAEKLQNLIGVFLQFQVGVDTDSYEQRLEDMEGYIKKAGYLKREFDDDLVRRLIERIQVLNENRIEIQFQSGIVMRQEMLREE